jgi:cysteine-rich repeat protein
LQLQTSDQEQCDDGNTINDDECDNACQIVLTDVIVCYRDREINVTLSPSQYAWYLRKGACDGTCPCP